MKSMYRCIRVMIVVAVALLTSVATATATDYAFAPEKKKPKLSFEWGVGVSGSSTTIRNISTTAVNINPKLALGAHLDMALCVGRNFAFETEINYEGASLKAKLANNKSKSTIRTRSIDIPLMVSLRMLDSRIRLSAGPLFTVKCDTEYPEGDKTAFFGPIYPTYNLAAGVGVGLSRHLIIEARYIYGLGECVNQYRGVEFTTQSSRLSVGMTLFF
jgi:hypothetical protein